MVITRRVVLKLGATIVIVYSREKNLINPRLEVVIEQATALLTFPVEAGEEEA